jgi:lipoprotein-anchoring transpeptidase ErfK/SrfK
MKRLILMAAVLAAGAAGPANAAQFDNSKMPFPAMMNALFGNPETTGSVRANEDATLPAYRQQASYAQPSYPQPAFAQPTNGQPARQAYGTQAAQPSYGFAQPGQRLPSYSGMTSPSSWGNRNVSALQPAPRNYVPTRQPQLPQFDMAFAPKVVAYNGPEKPGTIVINTNERFLYLVQNDGTAMRYGVGVGRPGFEWAGAHTITRKAEWPDWTPPAEMRQRQPGLPEHMPGGPRNPLGARAMYLGSTLYRIHGSNEPWTIGHAVSSGCIRMRNEDVIDLYGRVKVGTAVKVI